VIWESDACPPSTDPLVICTTRCSGDGNGRFLWPLSCSWAQWLPSKRGSVNRSCRSGIDPAAPRRQHLGYLLIRLKILRFYINRFRLCLRSSPVFIQGC